MAAAHMRPLPRCTPSPITRSYRLLTWYPRRGDCGGRPAVALHARDRGDPGARLAASTLRCLRSHAPPERGLRERPARYRVGKGAHGVQLGAGDLPRRCTAGIAPWLDRSLGAQRPRPDRTGLGRRFSGGRSIYETPSHPDHRAIWALIPPRAAMLGLPVIAIGGVTPGARLN